MADIPPVRPITPVSNVDPLQDLYRPHGGGGRKRPQRIDQPADRPAPLETRRTARQHSLDRVEQLTERDDGSPDRRRQQPQPEADEADSTDKGHVIDFGA